MRIVIVEDNTHLRESLGLLLGGEGSLEVIGSFGVAEEALPVICAERPQVLLVDLGLPGMSGIELIRKVKAAVPEVEALVHTISDDRDSVFAALKAGAAGYILKGVTPRELIEALNDLGTGGAPMSPKIARAVIREFQDTDVDTSEEYLLTTREREIVLKLEEGLTYKELAELLSVSHHTIHTHVKNIYEKLQAKGRRDALAKAKKKGII